MQAQHELQVGITLGISSWTTEQYLRHWLNNVVKPRVKRRTFLGYEGYVRLYLIPSLGSTRLRKLGPQHIQAMSAKLLERPASNRGFLLRGLVVVRDVQVVLSRT
ncbi:MAG: hypothetical protein HYU86_02765 [Chloroflexi bacterium]|nr:hypothetical protein [Chloroflexota bacterium]